MDRFDSDFLEDLESFVGNTATKFKIPVEWNASRAHAPERHLALGKQIGIPIEAIAYQLMNHNDAFEKIGQMLRIYFTRATFPSFKKEPIVEEAEQVWMFGWNWFSKYYELLLDVATLRSDFYRTKHSSFLALLTDLLAFDPAGRPSFCEALERWYPQSDLLKKEDQSEDDEDSAAAPAATAVSQPIVSEGGGFSSVSVKHASSLPTGSEKRPASQTTGQSFSLPTGSEKRRLVLSGWGGPLARNRTRKSRDS